MDKTIVDIMLQNGFRYIRETFFPEWDTEGKWKIKLGQFYQRGGSHVISKYDKYSQEILFFEIPADNNIFLSYIIHEICHIHPTETRGHDEEWINRMEKAANKALYISYDDLAKHVRRHIKVNKKIGDRKRIHVTELDRILNDIED